MRQQLYSTDSERSVENTRRVFRRRTEGVL